MQVNEANLGGPNQVAPNAGLAAFQVAVVQQKQFEETLQRVSEKQSEIVDDLERRVEEARKHSAKERGGVDIVVRGDDNKKSSGGDNSGSDGSGSDSRGAKVNVKV